MFQLGQRWRSDTEPELGLGIITALEHKTITLLFPASEAQRCYGVHSHPLRRVKFEQGDEITLQSGEHFLVEEVFESDGLFIYRAGEQDIFESMINDSMNFVHPEDRLLAGIVDSNKLFQLRYDTYQKLYPLLSSPLRGLLGGRVSLIPHQFYVVDQVTSRLLPRVLLGDEVGLGKTIEAGLIIHRLLVTGRSERICIVVPDSLGYQWFVEMLRKFQLNFMVINRETPLEEGSNPFIDHELLIVSLNLLKGSQKAFELACAAQWDLMVVDEAHQLKWAPGNDGERDQFNREYEIISALAQKALGLLLLTATPEQLGPAPHFGRLKLLDSDRFADFDRYCEETKHYGELGLIVKQLTNKKNKFQLDKAHRKFLASAYKDLNLDSSDLLKELIDRHGTGRAYFRNTRTSLEHVFDFFPKRLAIPHPLELSAKGLAQIEPAFEEAQLGTANDTKSWWLVELLAKFPTEKFLLICKSKDKVMALERFLKESVSSINIGMFHSGLSLLARDRQAAYFADPEGAQILLCTEIGSEGRNFEFAHHLILFDLPLHPDLLEQRIGRLDRIGQSTDIHIHIPYIKDSWEEVLWRWYHEGIEAFTHSPRGASLVFHEFKELLTNLLERRCDYSDSDHKEIAKLLKNTKTYYQKISHQIEEGRDILVEANSFNEAPASKIISDIKSLEEKTDLFDYMQKVFDQFGVEMEDLEEGVFFVRPNENMFIPHFPGLLPDGMAITFSRNKALEREDISFITWDHPMVVGIMDLITSQEYGNVTVATRKKTGKSGYFIEAYFKLQVVLPARLEADRYLSPDLIRVFISHEAKDFTDKWPKDLLDQKTGPADRAIVAQVAKIPKAQLKELLSLAKNCANDKSMAAKDHARELVANQLGKEIERLEKLAEMGSAVLKGEIEVLRQKQAQLLIGIEQSSLSLDCFRFIL